MADELVRVRDGDMETTMGRSLAEAAGLEVLDEPATRGTRPVADTRRGGRPVKQRTSVSQKAAEKKAASKSADSTAEEATK